jgi:dipeptidyl aminopeptidase/acylaminoacyl peptidase
VDAAGLPFGAIAIASDSVEFDSFGAHWRCSLDSYACRKVEDYLPPNPLEPRSPDGKWAVFRRGYDLWLRALGTGEERPLTSDGVAESSYGLPPDCLSFGVLVRRFGLPHLPPIVAWSRDSRRLITHRTDQRGVALAHLIESAPAEGGRPVLHQYRYAVPGDETMPRAELIVFDVETGTAVPAKTNPLPMPVVSPIMFGRVWWAADGSAVYYLEQSRDQHALSLKRLDPVTGLVRTLVEERGEPRVEPGQFTGSKPIVRVFSDGREVLWYSQRDGWGHLYLYDAAAGELRRQVTSGEWAVQQILHVDEARRIVYFVASGLVEADPYRRQVCRVDLDGSRFARVGDDDLDHIVTVPENEAYYVDSASTTNTPPVISVRGWDGDVIVELERADIARLVDTGWTPPERFSVKAADGETDIYGILYCPHDFDPAKSYPVIDHPYPGPQVNRVHPCFGEQVPLYNTEALAALGFVVMAVDGRGTPGRSRAFHDLAQGHIDKAGFLEDHVAALRQLATTRPWLDLDRVGIFGYSGGGFATVRAMCTYPEFYRVGVALCGNHEQRYYQLAWGETYDGPLDQETYSRSSNVEIADRLQGKLLLVHGEMDDNVHPQQTLLLVDRLIKANKDFDLLIVPGAEHLFIGYDHYVRRRKWDFLVRHLLGVEPPAGYRLAETRVDIEALFG